VSRFVKMSVDLKVSFGEYEAVCGSKLWYRFTDEPGTMQGWSTSHRH
jgi:hypothetical protein